MFDENDIHLQVVRVEIYRSKTLYFYYKIYNKENSTKFPSDKSILIYYFEPEIVNETIIREYFSLIATIDKISLGNFLNKSGSKKKRKVVNFALLKFNSSIDSNSINKTTFQEKINRYIENKKRRNLKLDYNLKEDDLENEEEDEDEKPDSDGFYEVKGNQNQNKFTSAIGNEMSFKVIKEEDEDSFMDEIKVKRKKKRYIGGVFKKDNNEAEEIDNFPDENSPNEGFWNIQNREKKKQSKYYVLNNKYKLVFNELKELFKKDKQILNNKRKLE